MVEDSSVASRGGDPKLAHLDKNDAHSDKNGVYSSDPELASPDDAAEIEKVERVYRKLDKRIIPRKFPYLAYCQQSNKTQHSGFYTSPAQPFAPTSDFPRP